MARITMWQLGLGDALFNSEVDYDADIGSVSMDYAFANSISIESYDSIWQILDSYTLNYTYYHRLQIFVYIKRSITTNRRGIIERWVWEYVTYVIVLE